MSSKIDTLIELMKENNKKLDKVCALVTSLTILQETISPEGEIRSADDIAELVTESFMSAVALDSELENRCKQFEYQMSEFFIGADPELESNKDNQDPPQMQFN